MKKETDSKIWDLVLMLFGALILPPAFAQLLGFMKAPLRVPIWVILSYSLVYAFMFYFMWRFLNLNAKEQRDVLTQEISAKLKTAEDEIESLSAALDDTIKTNQHLHRKQNEMESIVFDGGLYYRKSDDERVQPFCRICYDGAEHLNTVEVYDDHEKYWCWSCNKAYSVSVGTSKVTEGEEISF